MEKVYFTKKGVSPITIFFWVIIFIFVWVLFLADFWNLGVNMMINNNNLTGIEAFGYQNLVFVIFGAVIIFALAYMSYGGNQ